MRLRVIFFLLGIVTVFAVVTFLSRGKTTEAANPSSVFSIPPHELKKLETDAIAGNCHAAFRISRHHTFWIRHYEESVKWLRVAAKCDHIDAKEELILMLLDRDADPKIASEINSTLAQIKSLDPNSGSKYERLVATRRAARHRAGS